MQIYLFSSKCLYVSPSKKNTSQKRKKAYMLASLETVEALYSIIDPETVQDQ